MKDLKEIRKLLDRHRKKIREKCGVITAGVFGSYARGDESRTGGTGTLC